MTRVYWSTLFLLFTAAVAPNQAPAADYETISVEPGQSVDIYLGGNLSGQVFVAADIGGQPACLTYWWITWPLGKIIDLGHQCGRSAFDIPGLGKFALVAKLRAGGADTKTRVRWSADESVAHKFPEIKF